MRSTRNVLITRLLLCTSMALWEALVRLLQGPIFIVPPPSKVVVALWLGFASGRYPRHLYSTLIETLLGFLGGSALGFCLATAVATNRYVEYCLLDKLAANLGAPAQPTGRPRTGGPAPHARSRPLSQPVASVPAGPPATSSSPVAPGPPAAPAAHAATPNSAPSPPTPSAAAVGRRSSAAHPSRPAAERRPPARDFKICPKFHAEVSLARPTCPRCGTRVPFQLPGR